MKEIWASIPEFPSYFVSTYGRVRNPSGRILQPGGRTQRGYLQYHFFVGGRRYARYAHRLVASTFIACNIDGLEVDHLDDDVTNNHVTNLEIVTARTNSQRIYDRGRRLPPRMIAIRIVETGEEFCSISDCARTLDRSLSTVWDALRLRKTTAGVHLEEVVS